MGNCAGSALYLVWSLLPGIWPWMMSLEEAVSRGVGAEGGGLA